MKDNKQMSLIVNSSRTKSLRPFFPYYGSKWNIARYYPRPVHNLVIEPFAGAAGYATFYACPQVHLIDTDPIITGIWSYLIHASINEIMELPNLPEVGDCVDDYALCQEAKWLIGFWLNRGSSSPKKTRTAYSARTEKAQLVWGQRAKERIASQLWAIRNWKVTNNSYDSILNVEATWFVDPPYSDKGKYYRKPFTEFKHLGKWCRERNGMVVVCEGEDATWLPFKRLGEFKTTLGRAAEAVFIVSNTADAAV